jgi:hypothetical protein
MIDKQTGYDDDYDEALKFCIDEIIEEIHRVKELDNLAVDSIYSTIFSKTIEERWEEYKKECEV